VAKNKHLKYRLTLLTYFIIASIVGYYLKYYRGPGQEFINNMGPASIIYEILWIFIFAAIFSDPKHIKRITVGVALGTCFLEFLQLWKPLWLQSIRSTTLGSLILGNTFSWLDFPAYFIGSYLGYLILKYLNQRMNKLI